MVKLQRIDLFNRFATKELNEIRDGVATKVIQKLAPILMADLASNCRAIRDSFLSKFVAN